MSNLISYSHSYPPFILRNSTLPLTITISPLSFFRFQLYSGFTQSLEQQQSSPMGGATMGEVDELKVCPFFFPLQMKFSDLLFKMAVRIGDTHAINGCHLRVTHILYTNLLLTESCNLIRECSLRPILFYSELRSLFLFCILYLNFWHSRMVCTCT